MCLDNNIGVLNTCFAARIFSECAKVSDVPHAAGPGFAVTIAYPYIVLISGDVFMRNVAKPPVLCPALESSFDSRHIMHHSAYFPLAGDTQPVLTICSCPGVE